LIIVTSFANTPKNGKGSQIRLIVKIFFPKTIANYYLEVEEENRTSNIY